MCQSPVNIAEEIIKELEELIAYIEGLFKDGKSSHPELTKALGNLLLVWCEHKQKEGKQNG